LLYHLFEYLESITLLFGNRIIRSLKRLQVGESVRDLGLSGQKEKEGTPTMGGVMIILAIVIPTILLARLDNIYIILMLIVTIWFAGIGFIDDRLKLLRKNKDGLRGKYKIIGQVIMGLIVALVMFMHEDIVVRIPADVAAQNGWEITETFEKVIPQVNQAPITQKMAYAKAPITNVPFLKDNEFDYSMFVNYNRHLAWMIFIPIIIFIITSVSNGANLTDGLDGLLTGVAAIIGATLGIFLWFNSYPASVFMGDTGSLAIGGIIAVMAVLLRKEMLIPILCGIMLMENLSVVMQVSYFKYTKKKYGEGRRIFLMSPLHHHYQKKGMHEMKIVVRFWIVAILLAVMTIITLKLR